MIRKHTPATTGHSQASRDIARQSTGSFRTRVRLAIELLLNDQTNQRAFDNCFEMHDGTAVVLAIAREAQQNPLLASRIERFSSIEPDLPWLAFAAHFAHIRDLDAFAAHCRQSAQKISPYQLRLGL